MEIVGHPKRLRNSAFVLFGMMSTGLLFLFLVMNISREEFLKIGEDNWFFIGIGLSLLVSYLVTLGNRVWIYLMVAAAGFVTFLLVIHSFKIGKVSGNAGALIWFGATVYICIRIYREMSLAYIRPKIAWYEGALQAIPLMEAALVLEKNETGYSLAVNRIDQYGIFLFVKDRDQKKFVEIVKTAEKSKEAIRLRIKYKESEISTTGFVVCVEEGICGLGVEFDLSSADRQKEVIDLLEVLRGAGHVYG